MPLFLYYSGFAAIPSLPAVSILQFTFLYIHRPAASDCLRWLLQIHFSGWQSMKADCHRLYWPGSNKLLLIFYSWFTPASVKFVGYPDAGQIHKSSQYFSYCSKAVQKKETISLSGVREVLSHVWIYCQMPFCRNIIFLAKSEQSAKCGISKVKKEPNNQDS